MNLNKKTSIFTGLLLGTIALSSSFLLNGKSVRAATVTNHNGIVKINYQGKGGVAVWNNYQKPHQLTGKYLPKESRWKTFKIANTDDNSKWYNLGGNQWVDGQYVVDSANENTANTHNNQQSAYKVVNSTGVGQINYSGRGSVAVWNNYSNGHTTGKYLPKNSNWKYFKIATGNNKTWYNLGGNQWVDGQYFAPKQSQDNKTYILPYTYYSQLTSVFAPSACEAVSLKIALSTKGVANNLSVKDVIDRMPKTNSPETGFNGDPYKFAGNKFITIYPAPLAKYARSLGANAADISGASESQLISEIKAGNPLIVACNLHMMDNAPYHVSTVVGYKPGYFLIADPYRRANESGKVFWIDSNKFMQNYRARGSRVVVIR